MSIQKIDCKSKPFLARCKNREGKYIPATFKTRSEAEEFMPYNKSEATLRYSFASYAYYEIGVEHAVKILGHAYKTYKKFYKGIASIDDFKAYFKIVP